MKSNSFTYPRKHHVALYRLDDNQVQALTTLFADDTVRRLMYARGVNCNEILVALMKCGGTINTGLGHEFANELGLIATERAYAQQQEDLERFRPTNGRALDD